MNTNDFRRALDRHRGARDVLWSQLGGLKRRIEELTEAAENSRQAQALIHSVAKMTQGQLEYQLGDLGTMAQAAIFPDPYRFGARFEISRKSGTICQFYFERGEEELDPLSAAGGGPVDVSSWALRPSILPMTNNRKTLWLDEPFRFLSREYQPRAAVMLREVAHKLGIQIVMITHSPDLIAAADRTFRIYKGEDGHSTVEVDDASESVPDPGPTERKPTEKGRPRGVLVDQPLFGGAGAPGNQNHVVPPRRRRK